MLDVKWQPFFAVKRIITLRPCLLSFSELKLVGLLQKNLIFSKPCKPFHSINGHKNSSELFSIPKLDCTVDQNVLRINSMITKLSKDGRILEAQKLFDKMPDPDVISWTALITGYVKCGMIKEAKDLFDRVDAKKNVVTWTAMINGYVKMRRIFEAERLFEEMPEKNVVSWNTMIDGYLKCGKIDKALWLFEMMEERNVVSWNTVIAGLVKCGRVEEASEIFERMPQRNLISWTAMVAGLSRNGKVDEARLLFERMPERNVVSWNAMITGYAQNSRLNEAFDLFERMPLKDVTSWNTMMTGFIQNGDLRRANWFFNEMREKNVVSWTAMINGYVQGDQNEEALRIFANMLMHTGVRPNEGTFVSVLVACSDLAALGEGRQIHQLLSKSVYQKSDFVISALISMYSKCGESLTARKVFDDGIKGQRDLVSWNGIIAAYAHHGCGKEAIKLFQEMKNIGLKPNDVTYVGLLAACSHAGLVEEGFRFFDMLVNDRSIKLREDHCTCLIDLCGRAGRFEEAFHFIEKLPMKASQYDWGALLAGYNIHRDADIGKLAARKLLEARPESAGSFTLLSNIYASSGRWKEAAQLRMIMKNRRLKKEPGCSWIQVGNWTHLFVVGDKSHCETEHIYSLIGTLHSKMKKTDNIYQEILV
ncbi:hypothetical protein ACH5RR_036880 [Cinchona calisaya]|uniref:Chlororespiratory reduction 4 n=1 Tax=Cinchona calisaya TaxID=153742 RepID=A0ABD2Y4I2_9GENT